MPRFFHLDTQQNRLLIYLAITLVTFNVAADCSSVVKQLRTRHLSGATLWELSERYESAMETLRREGFHNAQHAGNIFATRFISQKDWFGYLSKNDETEFSAWKVYSPTPATWGNWAQAVNFAMNNQARDIWLRGSIGQIETWILNLHSIEMTSLLPPERVGKFRTDVAEIIPLHFLENAYTYADIEHLRRPIYYSQTTHENRACPQHS